MAFSTAFGAYLSNQQAKKQQRAYNDMYSQQQAFLREQQNLLNPYTQAGNQALNPLTALLTGYNQQGQQLTPAQRMGYFQESPGYQFRLEQGQNALNRLANARGQLFSGEQTRATERFAQGLASEEYDNFINRLMGLSNTGLQAANSQAGLGAQFAPMLSELGLGGAYNHFDKGAAFNNVVGSAIQLGSLGAINPGSQREYNQESYSPATPYYNQVPTRADVQLQSPSYQLMGRGGNY